ncbi:ankyrin repeat domain-containing protein [Amphritea sp. HPY]|uniref:ankyrin repeat domain-containing protein n=1 Tax=Amphritea sp. HPY TaxID=3421652 RepID=UPI003D7F012D
MFRPFLRQLLFSFGVLFFSLSISGPSTAGATALKSLKIQDVSYFSATLEFEFFLSEQYENSYLTIDLPISSKFATFRQLKPGLNKFVMTVARTNLRDYAITTQSITFNVHQGDMHSMMTDGGDEAFYSKTLKRVIMWPGPEETVEKLIGSPKAAYDFSSISHLYLNVNKKTADSLVKKLLLVGMPITKIFPGKSRRTGTTASITLGTELGFALSRKLVSILLSEIESVAWVQAKEQISRSSVYVNIVGFMPPPEMREPGDMTEEQYAILLNGDASKEQFNAIIGFPHSDDADESILLYSTARNLLDNADRGNLAKAKSLLDKLIRKRPGFAPAYLQLARFHMKSNWPGGLNKAEELILIARKLEPELDDVNVLLGYVYSNQGRFSEAEREFKRALTLGSDNLWLYANWGLYYQLQGLSQQALEMYLKTLKKEANNKSDKKAKRWVYKHSAMFKTLVSLQKYNKADSLYDSYRDEFPEDRCILQQKAALRLYYFKDYKGAINYYMKSQSAGCMSNTPVLALAYYLQWHGRLKLNDSSSELENTFYKAEAFAPEDGYLLYAAAVADGTSFLVPVLINKGKNINHEDQRGMTALLYSIVEQNLPAATVLLENGADPSKVSDKQLFFPLIFAIQTQNIDMVRLLLRYNADPSVQLPNGSTLEIFARQMGLNKIANLLQKGDVT